MWGIRGEGGRSRDGEGRCDEGTASYSYKNTFISYLIIILMMTFTPVFVNYIHDVTPVSERTSLLNYKVAYLY